MPVFVNGVEVTDEQVFCEMQYHPADSMQDAREKAALALTIRELLLQEAVRLDIKPPDTQADRELVADYLISALLEKEVKTPEPAIEDCERYYDKNSGLFRDRAGQVAPFQVVKESIQDYLKECCEQTAARQYIKLLAGKADIVGLDLGGADTPLVQ